MANINILATAVPPYYGTVLENGSSGPDVAQVQTWLNGVRSKWPQLPILTVDGKYGSGTSKAVAQFQTLVALTADGKTGNNTWNALYTEYAGIHGAGEIYPGTAAYTGTKGAVVKSMQQKLNSAARRYTAIQTQTSDGVFGTNTGTALRRFQLQFGLTGDSVMGKSTFDKLKSVVDALAAGQHPAVSPRYPGYVVQQGSSGDPVRFIQSYLSALGGNIPKVTVDGQFGSATRNSVIAFQAQNGLTTDGKVGQKTWTALVAAFNRT